MKKKRIKGYSKKKMKYKSGITILFDDKELFKDNY